MGNTENILARLRARGGQEAAQRTADNMNTLERLRAKTEAVEAARAEIEDRAAADYTKDHRPSPYAPDESSESYDYGMDYPFEGENPLTSTKTDPKEQEQLGPVYSKEKTAYDEYVLDSAKEKDDDEVEAGTGWGGMMTMDELDLFKMNPADTMINNLKTGVSLKEKQPNYFGIPIEGEKPKVGTIERVMSDERNRRAIASEYTKSIKDAEEYSVKAQERLFELTPIAEAVGKAQELMQSEDPARQEMGRKEMAKLNQKDVVELFSIQEQLDLNQNRIDSAAAKLEEDEVLGKGISTTNAYHKAFIEKQEETIKTFDLNYVKWALGLKRDERPGGKNNPISKEAERAADNVDASQSLLKEYGIPLSPTGKFSKPNTAQEAIENVYLRNILDKSSKELDKTELELRTLWTEDKIRRGGNNLDEDDKTTIREAQGPIATWHAAHIPWSSEFPDIEQKRKAAYTKSNSLQSLIKESGDKYEARMSSAGAAVKLFFQPLKEASTYDLFAIGDWVGNSYLKDIAAKKPVDRTDQENEAINAYAEAVSSKDYIRSMSGVNIGSFSRGAADMMSYAIPIGGWSKAAGLLGKATKSLSGVSKEINALNKLSKTTKLTTAQLSRLDELTKISNKIDLGTSILRGTSYGPVKKALQGTRLLNPAAEGLSAAAKSKRIFKAKAIAAATEAVNVAVVGYAQSRTIGRGRMEADYYEKVTGIPVKQKDGSWKFIDAMSDEEARRYVGIDQSAEYTSEMSGDMIQRVAGNAFMKTFGKRAEILMKNPTVKSFMKVSDRLTKASGGTIHNVWAEMGEEVLGNGIRTAFGIMDFHNEEGSGFIDIKQNVNTFLHLLTAMGGQYAVTGSIGGLWDVGKEWDIKRRYQNSTDAAFVDYFSAPARGSDGKENVGSKEAAKVANGILKTAKGFASTGNMDAATNFIMDNKDLNDEAKKLLLASVIVSTINGKSSGEIADDILVKRMSKDNTSSIMTNAGLKLDKPSEDHENKDMMEMVFDESKGGKAERTGILFNPKTGEFASSEHKNKFNSISVRSSVGNIKRSSDGNQKDMLTETLSDAMTYQHLANTGRLGKVMDKIDYKGTVRKKVTGHERDLELAKEVQIANSLRNYIYEPQFKSMGISNPVDQNNIIAATAFNNMNRKSLDKTKADVFSSISDLFSAAPNSASVDGKLRESAKGIIENLGLKLDIDSVKDKEALTTALLRVAIANMGDDIFDNSNIDNNVGKAMNDYKKQLRDATATSVDNSKEDDAFKLANILYSSNKQMFGIDKTDTMLATMVDHALINGDIDQSIMASDSELFKAGIFSMRNLKGLKNDPVRDTTDSVLEKHGIKIDSPVRDIENKLLAGETTKTLTPKKIKEAIKSMAIPNLSEVIEDNKELLDDIVKSISNVARQFDIKETIGPNGQPLYQRRNKLALKGHELDLMLLALDSANKHSVTSKSYESALEGFKSGSVVDKNNISEKELAAAIGVAPDTLKISKYNKSESGVEVIAKINLGSGLAYDVTANIPLDAQGRASIADMHVNVIFNAKRSKKRAISKAIEASIAESIKYIEGAIVDPSKIKVKKIVDINPNGDISYEAEYKDGSFIYKTTGEFSGDFNLKETSLTESTDTIAAEIYDKTNEAGIKISTIEEPVVPEKEEAQEPDETKSPSDSTEDSSKVDNAVFDAISDYLESANVYDSYSEEAIYETEKAVKDILTNILAREDGADLFTLENINSVISAVYAKMLDINDIERAHVYNSLDAIRAMESLVWSLMDTNANATTLKPVGICVSRYADTIEEVVGSGMSRLEDGLIATTIYNFANPDIANEYKADIGRVKFEYEFSFRNEDGTYSRLTAEDAKSIIETIVAAGYSDDAAKVALSNVRIDIFANLDGDRKNVGQFANILEDISETGNIWSPAFAIGDGHVQKAIANQFNLIEYVSKNDTGSNRYFADWNSVSAGGAISSGQRMSIAEKNNTEVAKTVAKNEKLDGVIAFSTRNAGVGEESNGNISMRDINLVEIDTVPYDANMATLKSVEKEFGCNVKFIDLHGAKLANESFNIHDFIDFIFLNKDSLLAPMDNSNRSVVKFKDSDGNVTSETLANGMSLYDYINNVISVNSLLNSKTSAYLRGLFFVDTDQGFVLQIRIPDKANIDGSDENSNTSEMVMITEGDFNSKTGNYKPFIDLMGRYSVNMRMSSTRLKHKGMFENGELAFNVPGIINTNGAMIDVEVQKEDGTTEIQSQEPESLFHVMVKDGLVENNFDGFYNAPFMYCKLIHSSDEEPVPHNSETIKEITVDKSDNDNPAGNKIVVEDASKLSSDPVERTIDILSNNSTKYKQPGTNRKSVTSCLNAAESKAATSNNKTEEDEGSDLANKNAEWVGKLLDRMLRTMIEFGVDFETLLDNATDEQKDESTYGTISTVIDEFDKGGIPNVFNVVDNGFENEEEFRKACRALREAKSKMEKDLGGKLVAESKKSEGVTQKGIIVLTDKFHGETDVVAVHDDGSISIIDLKVYSGTKTIADISKPDGRYANQVNMYAHLAQNGSGVRVRGVYLLAIRGTSAFQSANKETGGISKASGIVLEEGYLINIPLKDTLTIVSTNESGGFETTVSNLNTINGGTMTEKKSKKKSAYKTKDETVKDKVVKGAAAERAALFVDPATGAVSNPSNDEDMSLDDILHLKKEHDVLIARAEADTEIRSFIDKPHTIGSVVNQIKDYDLGLYKFVTKALIMSGAMNNITFETVHSYEDNTTPSDIFYNGTTNKSLIRVIVPNIANKQEFVQSMAHEIIHACLANQSDTNTKEWNKLRALFEEVKNSADKLSTLYMFKEVDEFLGESINDSAHDEIDKLVGISLIDKTRNLFNNLYRWAMGVFGVEIKSTTALQRKLRKTIIGLIKEYNSKNELGNDKRSSVMFSKKRNINAVNIVTSNLGVNDKEVVEGICSVLSFGRTGANVLKYISSFIKEGSLSDINTYNMTDRLLNLALSSNKYLSNSELVNKINEDPEYAVSILYEFLIADGDYSIIPSEYIELFSTAYNIFAASELMNDDSEVFDLIEAKAAAGTFRGTNPTYAVYRAGTNIVRGFARRLSDGVYRNISTPSELGNAIKNIVSQMSFEDLSGVSLVKGMTISRSDVRAFINAKRLELSDLITKDEKGVVPSSLLAALDNLTDLLINYESIELLIDSEVNKIFLNYSASGELDEVYEDKESDGVYRDIQGHILDDGDISLLESVSNRVKFMLNSIPIISATEEKVVEKSTGNFAFYDMLDSFKVVTDILEGAATVKEINNIIEKAKLGEHGVLMQSFAKNIYPKLSTQDRLLLQRSVNIVNVKYTNAEFKSGGEVSISISGKDHEAYNERSAASRDLDQTFGFSDDFDSAKKEFYTFKDHADNVIGGLRKTSRALTPDDFDKLLFIFNRLGFSISKTELITLTDGRNRKAKSKESILTYAEAAMVAITTIIGAPNTDVVISGSIENGDALFVQDMVDMSKLYSPYISKDDSKLILTDAAMKMYNSNKRNVLGFIKNYTANRKTSSDNFCLTSKGDKSYTKMQHNVVSSLLSKFNSNKYTGQFASEALNVKKKIDSSFFFSAMKKVLGIESFDGASSKAWAGVSGDKISLVRVNTAKSDITGAKSRTNDYKNRSPYDDYAERASRLIDGYIIFPTMADSGSGYSLHIEDSITGATNSDTSKYFVSEGGNAGAPSTAALKELSKMFLMELQACKNAYGVYEKNFIKNIDEKTGKRDPELLNNLVKNYHLSKDGRSYGNGLVLRRFRQLYSLNGKPAVDGDLNKKLSDLLNAKKYKEYLELLDTYIAVAETLAYGNAILFEESTGLARDIIDSMNGSVIATSKYEIEKMIEIGMVPEDWADLGFSDMPNNFLEEKKTDITGKALNEKEFYAADSNLPTVELAARRIALLNMLSMSQFERFLALDPANFEDEKDYNKRLKTYLSTGYEPSIDDSKPISFDLEIATLESDIENLESNIRSKYKSLTEDQLRESSSVLQSMKNELAQMKEASVRMADEYNDILAKETFSFASMSTLNNTENNVKHTDQYLIDIVTKSVTDLYKGLEGTNVDKIIQDRINSAIGSFTGIGGSKTKSTDGAAFLSLKMYRAYLIKNGDYKITVLDKMFKKIEKGEELSPNEAAIIATPLKLAYVDVESHNHIENRESHPVILKMACFPLLPSICKPGTAGHALIKMMDSQGIDMISDAEVVKVGQRYVHDIVSENEYEEGKTETVSFNDQQIQRRTLRVQFLRKQLETDPHEHTTRSMGTQPLTVALGNISGKKITKLDGTESNGDEIYAKVKNAMEGLSDVGVRKFLSDYGDIDENGKWYIGQAKLSKIIQLDALKKDLGHSVVEAAKLNVNGEIGYPVTMLMSSRLFESTIIAAYNKTAVDVETVGGSFIQVPHMIIRSTSQSSEEERGRCINNGERLKLINEHGSMDCVVSINAFRNILEQVLGTGYNFEDARNLLLGNEVRVNGRQIKIDPIIGKDAKPSAIGYRIPTQSMSSIPPLRVMDILDSTNGDVIIMPDGYVAITGSDFDIDKLYFATKYYEYSKSSGALVDHSTVIDNLNAGLESGTISQKVYNTQMIKYQKRMHANNLIDGFLDILTSVEMASLVYSSIDSGSAIFKGKKGGSKTSDGLIKDIGVELGIKDQAYYNSLSYQVDKKTENSGSKEGIGPFALMTTHHILSQIAKLKLTSAGKNILGVDDLGGEVSRDRIRITDWASYMVNAHVDAAKDPYILSFNINNYTWDATTLLLRAGFGSHTFYLTSQPIIKKLSSISINSKASLSPKSNKSNKSRSDMMEKEYISGIKAKIKEFVDDNSSYADNVYFRIADKTFNTDGSGAFANELNDEEISIIRDRFLSNDNNRFDGISGVVNPDGSVQTGMFRNDGIDVLLDNIKHAKTVKRNAPVDDKTAMYLVDQLLIANLFNRINKVGAELNTLTSVSQIDTKKFGKSRLEMESFDKKVLTAMTENEYIANPHDIFEKTHIGRKYYNTYTTLNKFFEQTTETGKIGFIHVYDVVKSLSNKEGYIEKSDATKIAASIQELSILPFIKDLAYDIYKSNNPSIVHYEAGSEEYEKAVSATIMELIKGKKNISKKFKHEIRQIAQEEDRYLQNQMPNGKYRSIYESSRTVVDALRFIVGDGSSINGTRIYGLSLKNIPDKKSGVIKDIELAFEKLAENPYTNKLAKEIFVSSFFSSGLTSCRNDIFNMVKTVLGPKIQLKDGTSIGESAKDRSKMIGSDGLVFSNATDVLRNLSSSFSIAASVDDSELEGAVVLPTFYKKSEKVTLFTGTGTGTETKKQDVLVVNNDIPFAFVTEHSRGSYRTITQKQRGKTVTHSYKLVGITDVTSKNSGRVVDGYVYILQPSMSLMSDGFIFKTHGMFSLDNKDSYLAAINSANSYEDLIKASMKEYISSNLNEDMIGALMDKSGAKVTSINDILTKFKILDKIDSVFSNSKEFIPQVSDKTFTNYISELSKITGSGTLNSISDSLIDSVDNKTASQEDLIDHINNIVNGVLDSSSLTAIKNAGIEISRIETEVSLRSMNLDSEFKLNVYSALNTIEAKYNQVVATSDGKKKLTPEENSNSKEPSSSFINNGMGSVIFLKAIDDIIGTSETEESNEDMDNANNEAFPGDKRLYHAARLALGSLGISIDEESNTELQALGLGLSFLSAESSNEDIKSAVTSSDISIINPVVDEFVEKMAEYIKICSGK